MSIIFHIDVNSAFLSWSALERLRQGEETVLRLIPSIIGGDQTTRH
ncbi:MAG: DNA polymerase IV, partial [Lachnospiraceae bacterium]|nr:DNA polymerase IV [Lachnospiraceae bacterium]